MEREDGAGASGDCGNPTSLVCGPQRSAPARGVGSDCGLMLAALLRLVFGWLCGQDPFPESGRAHPSRLALRGPRGLGPPCQGPDAGSPMGTPAQPLPPVRAQVWCHLLGCRHLLTRRVNSGDPVGWCRHTPPAGRAPLVPCSEHHPGTLLDKGPRAWLHSHQWETPKVMPGSSRKGTQADFARPE